MLYAAIALAFVILAFLAFVATRPPGYVISREIVIASTPEKIFPHLVDSKLAYAWMPWKEEDPGAVMEYSGPASGVGARSSWDSKGRLGKGSSTVVEVENPKRVAIQLAYERPMNMRQLAEYLVQPGKDGTTTVTWRVSGESPLVGRLMCMFINMDKMVGSNFEKGLANLKRAMERA
jgi:uncharacterized protein YndB with AHSA1/START domain